MNLLYNFFEDKYNLSSKVYKIILKDEPFNIFLFYYDILNVYNLFPTIIDFKLPPTDNLDISVQSTQIIDAADDTLNKTSFESYIETNKQYKKLLKQTIEETQGQYESCDTDKYVRKFFSYEIIDLLTLNYNVEYVTVAWLKCYEMLEWYKLITKKNINYFGICEQPGAFVYAINHYIKTHDLGDFNFILQSLRVNVTRKSTGFKAEDNLYKTYEDRYDYGKTETGDVTNLENIKYYRQKYYDKHFDLISADCGLDCSDDFSLQEKKIFKIFFGQLLVAISLADVGTNYFTKLFTSYSLQTTNLMYLLSTLFEEVYLSRVLTTKSISGEVYLVCKNFKYTKKEFDNQLKKIYDIYEAGSIPSFLNIKEDTFLNFMSECNKILLHRRIIAYRSSYFRYQNRKYTSENQKVIKYVKEMTDHYANYFITHYKIKKLNDKDKLVAHKFISKWIKPHT